MSIKKKQDIAAPEALLSAHQHDPQTERFALDERDQIVYASESFCDLSGRSCQKIRGADRADIFEFLQTASDLSALPPGPHDIRIKGRKKTERFHFDWVMTPDNKRYLIGARAKDTPELQAKDLQEFQTLAREMMVVTDAQGQVQRSNAVFQALSSEAEDFIDIFTDADKPHVRQCLQSLSLGKTRDVITFSANQMEFEGRLRDGRWTVWQPHKKGSLIYFLGRDITDIRNQKKELGKHEEQLLEAEKIGRMGHWRWAIGQNSVEWSREIYRIFGLKPDRCEPTLEMMNAMIHRRDINRVNQAFERAIIEENDYDMEFRITRPDGQIRYIHCEGRCERDSGGDVVALFGIMQDMTERMLYEQELRDAKDAAERAYATKSQFLANMSHELRTPLNAIIGFSEMMQAQLLGPIGNEKYMDYVGGIRESGEHLLDLISDILDMSKIEAGKYELEPEEVNVLKTIKVAVHMIEGRALEAGVKITIAPMKNEELKIVADRRALLQIVLNLLSNAVKFSQEGGHVNVECHERETYLALKVCDDGIGIPANKLAQITKPFEQASASYAREHEGSGLGLAITKELAELHGGGLFIESVVGEGTKVTVRLPYNAQSS